MQVENDNTHKQASMHKWYKTNKVLPLSSYKPMINWLIDDSIVIVVNDISLDQHKDAGTIYPIDDDVLIDWFGLRQD